MTTPSPHLAHPKYRPDIDGLRAVAILSVVAFHAFPSWMKGGFIGVDVFFVISGFLISTLIFENLDSGTFSFSEFYARRIKRIFPALSLILITSYIFGWFALLSDEYKQLGKHVASGAAFISNFVFLNESGYFDTAAETKPLLHLWSLGIEEQFYIAWPVVLWLAKKRNLNTLILTAVIAIISFGINIHDAAHDQVVAFYSPQTRFWELLSGSILAWLALYKKNPPLAYKFKTKTTEIINNYISFSGLLILIYGLSCIKRGMHFPGIWASIPVFGTVFIIAAGPKAWINKNILSRKSVVLFGLISFPLYLWHWPLLSFARIVESDTPSPGTRIAAVAVSILLSWLTYKLLERPIRFGRNSKIKIIALVSIMTAIGSVGYYSYWRDGLPFRMEGRKEFVAYFSNNYPDWLYFKRINILTAWRCECSYFNAKKYLKDGRLAGGVTDSKPIEALDPSCYKRNPRFEKSVLIWGDSHAQSLSPGLTTYMPRNWQILQIASSGCAPDPNIQTPSTESQCKQSNYFAMKTIKEAVPDVVVIAQVDGHSVKVMNEISRKLKTFGVKKILFLGPLPQWVSPLPKIFARRLWLTKPARTFVGINHKILDKNNALLQDFPTGKNPQFVNVIGFFCNTNGCLTHTTDDIKESITTWDYGHLTPSASRYLAKNLLVRRITE